MNAVRIKLHPKQFEAFESEATEILYGGAAGAGKSLLMRAVSIALTFDIPNLQIYLFRRTYPDLIANHMNGSGSLPELLGPFIASGQAKLNPSRNEIEWSNGAKIHLCHCQHEQDVLKYQGAEIHVLLIDELTHFTEYQYRFLRNRVRLGGLKVPDRWKAKLPFILTGSNPGGVGHCVPYGDVLTPEGWKDIKTMLPGDAVYTVLKDGSLQETVVDHVYAEEIAEPIVSVQMRGFTMECTQDHKIAKAINGTYELTPFSDLPGQAHIMRGVEWNGQHIETFNVGAPTGRKRRLNQPQSITGDQYAELCGWMVSEGHTVDRDKAFVITQIKQKQRVDIESLLKSCGFDYRNYQTGYCVHAPEWYEYFAKWGKCRDKRVPEAIRRATKEQLRLFFDAAMAGDGHWRSQNGGEYYTTSKALADDMSEIAIKLGYVVYQSQRQRKNRQGLSYSVSFKKLKLGYTEVLTGHHLYNVATTTKRKTDVQHIPFKGMVYCIGIKDTHTFVIRQNGSNWVSGNTWVKRTFIDMAAPMEIRRMPPDEGGMLRQFIPARLEDNPTLTQNDPGYEDRLSGLGSESLVRAMREGDWNITAGAAFEKLSRTKHMIRPFEIPRHWTKFTSLDWGTAKPYCNGWYAVNDEEVVIKGREGEKDKYIQPNSIIMYRELYGWNGKPNEGCREESWQVAKKILSLEDKSEKIDYRIGDSAMWAEHDGPSVAENFARNGVLLEQSRKDRIANYLECRNRLDPDEDMPGFYAFETCYHFWRTVPDLQLDERQPEKGPETSQEDHHYDQWGYAMVSRPMVWTHRARVEVDYQESREKAFEADRGGGRNTSRY